MFYLINKHMWYKSHFYRQKNVGDDSHVNVLGETN